MNTPNTTGPSRDHLETVKERWARDPDFRVALIQEVRDLIGDRAYTPQHVEAQRLLKDLETYVAVDCPAPQPIEYEGTHPIGYLQVFSMVPLPPGWMDVSHLVPAQANEAEVPYFVYGGSWTEETKKRGFVLGMKVGVPAFPQQAPVRSAEVQAISDEEEKHGPMDTWGSSEVQTLLAYIATLEAHSPVNTAQPAGMKLQPMSEWKRGHVALILTKYGHLWPYYEVSEDGWIDGKPRLLPGVPDPGDNELLENAVGFVSLDAVQAALTQPVNTGPSAEEVQCCEYLQRVLTVLKPSIQLLPTLSGVCTQVDSYMALLHRQRSQLVELVAEADLYVASHIHEIEQVPQCYGEKPKDWRKRAAIIIEGMQEGGQ